MPWNRFRADQGPAAAFVFQQRANLLLGAQGAVWLTDFGLAKAAQSDDVSLSKDVVGTLRYMPPEQLQALAEASGWGGSLTATPTRAVIEIAPTPAEAWDAVHRLAGPDDLVCITGSFFLAAEMRRQLTVRPFS